MIPVHSLQVAHEIHRERLQRAEKHRLQLNVTTATKSETKNRQRKIGSATNYLRLILG